MHARLTWDPKEDLTRSKHVYEHLLWALQVGHMPYYMGLVAVGVYMSQYWHFGPFFHFLCARRVEVIKMLSLCFEPDLWLIKRLKALGRSRKLKQDSTVDIVFALLAPAAS